MSLVAFAGSRSLPVQCLPLVRAAAHAVRRSGRQIATGCAVGTDQAAVQAMLDAHAAAQLVIFAAGGQDGHGFWRCSAFPQVLAAHHAGAEVFWWSGGPPALKLRQRLMGRSRAMLDDVATSGAGAALVAFLSSPGSRGTATTMLEAARLGLPVVAFCCGFSADRLRPLGKGAWAQAAPAGFWSRAWRWVDARQARIVKEQWEIERTEVQEEPLIEKAELAEVIDQLPADMTIAQLREYMPQPQMERLVQRTFYTADMQPIATFTPRPKDAPRQAIA